VDTKNQSAAFKFRQQMNCIKVVAEIEISNHYTDTSGLTPSKHV